MTSKEAIEIIKKYENLISDKIVYTTDEIINVLQELEKINDILDDLLYFLKDSILEATDDKYIRGDNIIADSLRDTFGLMKLKEWRKMLERN